ncbi:MAG: carbohydrate ABC transporter permease [Paenibacillaceae bacterium]|nr:carbohydrate ABC transporter permease [Paenibacillaceae bacterium]
MNSQLSRSKADRVFDACNRCFFAIVLLLVVYPLYFIIIASISDPLRVANGEVWLWPNGFNLDGYREIFSYSAIWIGYKNAFLYTAVGTMINAALTVTGGYALSRRDLPGRDLMMLGVVFTMFFSGGLIPLYLLVRDLGLLDSMWALILPGAVSAYYLIIVRTYFQTTIPKELLEAAHIDGCSDFKFFLRIVVPLSLPIIAVIALFYAVMHWNAYFNAMIFINDEAKFPLQLVLRKILILNDTGGLMSNPEGYEEQLRLSELIKFGVIIVASLPVLILYPLLQKYFIQGVMIGSIKG